MSSEIKLIPRGDFTKAILTFLYKKQLRVLKVFRKRIVTKPLGKPPLFYVEGLAMYFGKTWHGSLIYF